MFASFGLVPVDPRLATVRLYARQDLYAFTHADRIEDRSRNSWESKLGLSIRINHTADGLRPLRGPAPVQSMYGDPIRFYARKPSIAVNASQPEQATKMDEPGISATIDRVFQSLGNSSITDDPVFERLFETWKRSWSRGRMIFEQRYVTVLFAPSMKAYTT